MKLCIVWPSPAASGPAAGLLDASKTNLWLSWASAGSVAGAFELRRGRTRSPRRTTGVRDSDSGEVAVAGLLRLVSTVVRVSPPSWVTDAAEATRYVLPGSNRLTSRQAFSVDASLANRSPIGAEMGSRGDRTSVVRPCF